MMGSRFADVGGLLLAKIVRAAVALGATGLAAAPAAAAPLPGAPGCAFFPPTDPWNQRVDTLPVAAGSQAFLREMRMPGLHPDFSDQGRYGIPFTVVGGDQPRVPVSFEYDDESDPGPYPIPPDAPVEGGGDRHVLVVDRDACRLYELFAAERLDGGARWRAGSGAVFDLRTGAPRPDGWTSADAAGLPILPGLARSDEVARGEIDHALRVTVSRTQAAYLFPARHLASSLRDPAIPPMGLRLRLKPGFRVDAFGPQSRVVLTALKRYGMIVADNGSSGFISGAPSPAWDDDDLHELKRVPASAFEVVDTSSLAGTPPPRVLNAQVSVARGRVTARALHTAAGPVRLVALSGRRARTVARLPRARQGVVTLTARAAPGARYLVRTG